MKYIKTTLLVFTFINMMNFFSSCTPESLAKEDVMQKEQFNSNIQATDDGDTEIDKSDRHGNE